MLKKLLQRLRRHDEIVALQRELAREKEVSRKRKRQVRSLRRRLNQGKIGVSSDDASLPSRLVWIFGGGRSGTTWVADMMNDLDGQEVWFEPGIGAMLNPYALRMEKRRGTRNFILSDRFSGVWMRAVRNLVLDGVSARFPNLNDGGYAMIKEPAGSVGAKKLSEALPESRMILLVRDPRDVVASWKDAMKDGAWHHGRVEMKGQNQSEFSAVNRADAYFKIMIESLAAYDSHPSPRTLVKYEDLITDTLGEMTRMYSEIGVNVNAEELASVVEKHSWKNIPDSEKGAGKFYRKGSSGGWREDLTPEEIAQVEDITAPAMKALGYQRSTPETHEISELR